MTRTYLMVGMSAIAFAAGAASAQTNPTSPVTQNGTYGPDSNNNRISISCSTDGTNNCSVDQGANGTTFSSSGTVSATGSYNLEQVNQRGNQQTATASANGNHNNGVVTQRGFSNSGTISQTGSLTGAQAAGTAPYANYGRINQGTDATGNGSNNTATITQSRTSGAANTLGGNSSTITQGTVQGGFNNAATSNQTGTNLTSTISQTDDNGSGIASSNNSATVTQNGRNGIASTGSSSTVTQRQRGNTANVNLFDGGQGVNSQGGSAQNVSSVTQQNTLFTAMTNGTGFANATATNAQTTQNSPVSGNQVTVSITGSQNNSTATQNGAQNTVDQTLLTGGPGNTSATNAQGTNPGTGDAFPAARPEGNSSTIAQIGRGNYAATSIGGVVTTGGGRGNVSNVTQSSLSGGATSTAATNDDASTTQTTLNSTLAANSGHRTLVYQRGILDSATINQSNNRLGGNASGTTQNTQGGSLADLSQLSFNSQATITQVGSNSASVTQGAKNETTGANDVLTINQTDAGDTSTTTTNAGNQGGFGGTGATNTSTPNFSRNFVTAVQYGIQNTGTVTQNGINASATVYQAVGTRANTINVQQGTQANGGNNNITGLSANQVTAQNDATNNTNNTQNVTATAYQTSGQSGTGTTAAPTGVNNFSVNNNNGAAQQLGITIAQSGQNLTATANQAGGMSTAPGQTQTNANTQTSRSSFNSIEIAQANRYSSATVNQNGLGLIATVEQRSTNSTAALQSLVTINQSGGGTMSADANVALARQTTGAGASQAGGATAGYPGDANFPNSRSGANAYSAEIAIMQSGTGDNATVEQRDRGQYASITQTGSMNSGTILQDTGATNAVAMLSQSGSTNTYTIYQNMPGQYINVAQNGSGNITTFQNGPSGTGGGGNMGVGTTDNTGNTIPNGRGIGTVQ